MVRISSFGVGGKHKSTKFALYCVGLFGLALLVDLLWASSNSSPSIYQSIVSQENVVFPSFAQIKEDKKKKDGIDKKRVLADNFADLDAPVLNWEKMANAPVPRLDGAAIQIKDQLFVFAGYGTIDYVHSHVDIYNFTDNTWGGRFDMPKEMAHSHLGMVTDGRYIYIVTGQYGPQCRGPTAQTFTLDTVTKKWRDLPPLPVPRHNFSCCNSSYVISLCDYVL
ncbi:hypothetical protein Leryth_012625 [Lithospermum erythrorhizon]|nr:hypothetical protein Leryth_012625 [Lithospermum erythrorhizon]